MTTTVKESDDQTHRVHKNPSSTFATVPYPALATLLAATSVVRLSQ